MTRKIKNPYIHIDDYNCFACSPKNNLGLRMDFYEDNDYIISDWEPRIEFHGYKNILHGGIQATLMDEIASWTIQVKLKKAGVTSKMETKYKKPVYCDEGNIKIKAIIKAQKRNLVEIYTCILNKKEEICAESLVTYFTFSEKVAKENLYYPDFDSFFD